MSTLHIYDETKERREQLLAAALKKHQIWEFRQAQPVSRHPLLTAIRALVKAYERPLTAGSRRSKALQPGQVKG